MSLQLENGVYALGPGGLPRQTGGLEELLQNVRLRLTLQQGDFPYAREWGSRLAGLNLQQDHAARQAVSLANEALLDLPEARVEQAELLQEGGIRFTVDTPFGKGTVIYGDL